MVEKYRFSFFTDSIILRGWKNRFFNQIFVLKFVHEFNLILKCWFKSRLVRFGPKWVRLAPNETNPDFVRSDFRTFWLTNILAH